MFIWERMRIVEQNRVRRGKGSIRGSNLSLVLSGDTCWAVICFITVDQTRTMNQTSCSDHSTCIKPASLVRRTSGSSTLSLTSQGTPEPDKPSWYHCDHACPRPEGNGILLMTSCQHQKVPVETLCNQTH